MSTSFLPACSTSCPGPWPRTSAEGEYTRRNSYGSSKRLPSANAISSTLDFWCSVISVGVGASDAAMLGTGRLTWTEGDALEVGAALDELGEPHPARAICDLHLAVGLEPAGGDDEGFRSLEGSERRQQETLGEGVARGVCAGRLDRDPLGNAREDLHADAQAEIAGHRHPLDRRQQVGLALGELDPEQLVERHASVRLRIYAFEPQLRGAFIPDIPGLARNVGRGAGFALVARREAPERRHLHVLLRGHRPLPRAHRETLARHEVVDRGQPERDLRGPARAVPRVRARLLVLAPAPV